MCISLIRHGTEVKLIQGFDGNTAIENAQWEGTTKINLQETGQECMNWSHWIQSSFGPL
jgi:hypothetical protein